MKVTDHIAAAAGKTLFSFEVLPPLKGMRRRTKMGRLLGISPSPKPTPAKREVPAKDGIDYDALARAVLRRLTAAS